MENRDKAGTIKCYRKEVSYSVDDIVYFGTIQYIGKFGTSIFARNLLNILKGKKICINMLSQNQFEVMHAEVVYVDETSFGAKFVRLLK